MRARPKLSLVGEAHIRELRERWHVEPTIEEMLWIHELGLDVECPCHGERFDLIGTPVRAGNAWLWPMTVMAAVWWNDFGSRWFAGSGILYLYALAFALAHGRGAEVVLPGRLWPLGGTRRIESLALLLNREDASRAVSWWALRCGATRAEVEAAVDACLPPPPTPRVGKQKPQTKPIDWQEIVHELCIMSGESASYWTTGTSMASTANAYARAYAIQAARGGMSSPSGGPAADALRAIRAAMAEIVAAHTPPKEAPCAQST